MAAIISTRPVRLGEDKFAGRKESLLPDNGGKILGILCLARRGISITGHTPKKKC
ncbi:MAG TPA: hypothetical protein VKK79_05940 [Candidatus Lokiarchaeia archaeon]|nr:hypothetical protein [Candidatus Lokiarchaeia archaeon]